MNSRTKKLISLLCTAAMLVSALPVSALAADEGEHDHSAEGCAYVNGAYVCNPDVTPKPEAAMQKAALFAAPRAASGFLKAEGYQEGAYATWSIGAGVKSYTAYVAPQGGNYTKLDNELVREYPGYMRADALGLRAGTYTIKVVDDKGNEMVTDPLTVVAHERTGFAFVNGSSSGAYTELGTLKPNAQVLYVTKASDISDKIVDEVWNNTKNKYTDKPMCIRVIGHVTMSGVMGFQGWTNGLTVEGVGNDAMLTGGGVFIKGCSNVEVRNLGVMHVQKSGKNDLIAIEQKNDHVWVHNCDLFYGFDGSGDQAKGDGSLDVKESHYCSFSYNHFWDSGKCSLLGMHEDQNYMTYHHNWFDHSDSRHPRIRIAKSVHIYNNYYDGVAKYGVGAAENSGAFVEANYFRNTRYPMLSSLQGSDVAAGGIFSDEPGGIIKAYNNKIIGAHAFIPYNAQSASKDFDAYVAKTRDEKVPSSVAAKVGGTTYSNFDTTDNIGVTAAQVQSPDDAMLTTTRWAGRAGGSDLTWEFNNAVEDSNYSVITELNNKLNSYETTLVSVGGTVTKPVSGGDTPTHTHTPGAWKVTKVPSCNKDTQALVPGEETQYCTVCGEVLDTRPLAGAHSNDGQGKCTVCGATVANGGGPTVSADSKVLDAIDFIMHETTGDKNNTAAMRAEDMAAVEDGYFTMSGSGVNKRTKNATTVGSKAEWIDLPKSGNGGIQFTVTNVPADVNVTWGNTGGGQTSYLLIKKSDGTQIAMEDHTDSKSSSKTKTSVKLTEQGTYIIASKLDAGYSVRLYQIVVTEAPKPHNYGNWEIVTEATCTEDGLRKQTCQDPDCGDVKYDSIEALGHDWDDGVVGENGDTTYTCKRCHETMIESGDDPTPPPVVEVKKDALNAKLAEAAKADAGVSISADGSDVPTTGKWATEAAFDALDAAVKAAQAVADKTDATQDEVDAQVTALTAALAAFQPKNGTKVPGSGGGNKYTLTAAEVYNYLKGQGKTEDGGKITLENGVAIENQGTNGIFTVYPKKSGKTPGSIDNNSRKWDDLTDEEETKRFNFGGNSMTMENGSANIGCVIQFKIDEPFTVKVWWGTNTATAVALYVADSATPKYTGEKVAANTSASYTSTIAEVEAGTYYLGGTIDGAKGGFYPVKVEVTVASSGDTPATPDADKTDLNKAITAAEDARRGVVASVDGTDVAKTDYWATQTALDAIDAAITEAKKVARQAAPTQKAVDDAAKALNDAVALFQSQKTLGKKDDGTVTPPATQYNLIPAATSNGAVSFRVGGSAVTKAVTGATVTVVATPASGYKVDTITTTPTVTVTNRTFTMPAANVTVIVTFVQDGGGSGGGGGGGSFGGGGGGGVTTKKPAGEIADNVITMDSSTTAGHVATVELTDSQAKTLTGNAVKSGSDEIVVSVNAPRSAAGVCLNVSASALKNMSGKTDAALTLQTPVGNMRLPHAAVAGLGSGSGKDLSFTVARTNDGMKVTVTSDDKTLDAVSGGVTVVTDANGNGTVAYIRTADGEKLLKKSYVDDGKLYANLPGSGEIVLKDNAKTFRDVEESWAKSAIDFATSRELFNGVNGLDFAPNQEMTRSMLVTVLYRLEGTKSSVANKFADVPADSWYTEAVAWANAEGIVSGKSATHFGPDDDITREQLATILYRYATKLCGMDEVSKDSKALEKYPDQATVSGFATDGMKWAVEQGIIGGRGDGTLAPSGFASRAEVATMLMRFIKAIV